MISSAETAFFYAAAAIDSFLSNHLGSHRSKRAEQREFAIVDIPRQDWILFGIKLRAHNGVKFFAQLQQSVTRFS